MKNSNLPRPKEQGGASDREFFFLSYYDEIVPRLLAVGVFPQAGIGTNYFTSRLLLGYEIEKGDVV